MGQFTLWPTNGALGIAFLDGSEALRERTLWVAQEWTGHANLCLRMVAPQEADIRVSFEGQAFH